MLSETLTSIFNKLPAKSVHAHCDGPCGVYDPASARVAAEAVLSMTKKLIALAPAGNDQASISAYNNTFSRFVAIKEEESQKTKNLRNPEQPRVPRLLLRRERRAWQDVLLDQPSKGVALAQFGIQRHGDLAQGLAEGPVAQRAVP